MMQRMKELIFALQKADTAYHKHDQPIMSDREYDLLYDELFALEEKTGILLAGSPVHKVSGELLESLAEVTHTRPMLSAGKTKSIDEVFRFAQGRKMVLSWKLDGLTLVLRYTAGVFTQAITRGREGLVGEDVTHTAKLMSNIPLRIPYTDDLEVRGECVVGWNSFKQLNDGLEEPYSHPRGLAAGSIRKLDAEAMRNRRLEFLAFDLISDHADSSSKWEQLRHLRSLGFDVVGHSVLAAGASHQSLSDAVALYNPEQYDYPVDGLIIEYDDLSYGRSLGSTGHHENRLIALKWQDELYDTVFRGLELATTRTGMVSVTGVFDDVQIDGSTVNHAYLHNLDILDKLELGIGDRIQVYKANQIIPQIAENSTRSGTLTIPTHCPCCGEPVVIRQTSGGTRQLFCENTQCPAKLVRKFVHFCSKTRMDIEGLSESTLEKFIQHGWVKNFGDLYELDRYKAQIVATDGFGEKSFARLQAAIDKRRCCTMNQFIAGLGIHTVGRHAGRDLAQYFHGSWAAFELAIQENFDFTTLPDFGETMHNNIYSWYADTEADKLWRPLLQHITFIQEEQIMSTHTNNPFSGKNIVATGKLEQYTRQSIEAKILSLGATPQSSVTKTTDFLIVGAKAGSKLAKAQQLGITILSEAEFEAMLEA